MDLRQLVRKPLFRATLVAGALLGAAGVWALLHPGGLWLRPWRAESVVVSTRYIFGPYPLAGDFDLLKRQGVTTIISLLDPDLPYEAVLLADERDLAAAHGMTFHNFPMASILGQSFGDDYLANSEAAARAAIESKGPAYIHCYLGLHRAANVRKILEANSPAAAESYAGTLQPERDADVVALDRANVAFLEGRHEDTLRQLATLESGTFESIVLGAWANFRLGRIDAARTAFTQALAMRPGAPDALGGLGYCALRDGRLEEAAARFREVLAADPADAQAMEGLGYVLHQQGHADEATRLFQRVLAAHPENDAVRAMLN